MIVGRISLIIGKAVAIKSDGSSRELSLGDSIESDELISVSASGKIVVDTNGGEQVTVNANETWVAASSSSASNIPKSTTDASGQPLDPNSVEAIQAALLAGADPTEGAEATAAGAQGAAGAGGLGNEGSSFVRLGRGNSSAVDSGLNFETIGQAANAGQQNVFDPEIFQSASLGGAGSGFVVYDDIGSDGLPSDTREVIVNNSSTNDSAPTLEGVGAIPGAVIRIYDNGALIASATANTDGTWQIDTPTLSDDPHSITVTQQQAGFTESDPSAPINFIVDTQPPAALSFIATDDQGNITGPINSGDSTDDTQPTFSGSDAEAGAVIDLRDENGASIGSTTADKDGKWSITPETPLTEGEHQITAVQADLAGNESPVSESLKFSVKLAPDAPVLNSIIDDVGLQTGEIENATSTDDSRPVISGTAEAGSTITLLDNGQIVGTAIVDSQGNWSAEPNIPLNTGDHSITVTATNEMGNVSEESSPARTFTVDLPGPDAPSIENVIDDVVPQHGNISKGTGVTDDTTPTVNGSAQAGAIVTLYDADKNILGTDVADDDGNWSIAIADTEALSEGMQSITAKAELNNVESPETGAYIFEVDTSTPSKPGPLIITDDQGETVGVILNNDTTDDRTPTISGSGGTSGSTVSVLDGDREIGTAIVQLDGTWSVTPAAPLTDGLHSITATETAPNGKVSEPSTAAVFTVDTSAVLVSISYISDDVEGIVGDVADNGLTNDSEPTVQGTASAGAVVAVLLGDVVIGSTTASSQGTWSFAVPTGTPLLEGDNQLTAQVQNPSNETVTSNEFSVTLDTEAPSKIDAVVGTDDVGAVQGNIPEGGKTDDPTPTFSGGGDPGDVIEIFDNGKPIGSTTVNAEGEWQFTPSTPLPAGDHSITVAPTDPAGNTGDPSDPLTFEIDIITPPSSPSIQTVQDNVGNEGGKTIDVPKTSGVTNDATPTIIGTSAAGLTVRVYNDGQLLGETTANGDGHWSYTPATAFVDGVYKITADAIDAEGVVSEETGVYDFRVDLQIPDAPSLVAHDDQGDHTGPINNQDTTDDAQPAFSGSDAEPGAVIELRDTDGTPIGSATVDNAGAWAITPVIPLTEGEHKISAVQTDAAGNESPASELTFTVDLDPNTVIITHAVDNVEQNTGNLATGARINDQTPEITGTAKADSLVRLFQDNLEIGSVTADSNGVWSIVVAELANGDYNFTATATDAANNTVTSNSFQLTIDTLASDNIGPIVVTDDVGSIQGEITDQAHTDDTTPTISGSGATPGDYIQVFDGSTLISADPEVDPSNAVQVDEYGNWTFTPSNPLPEGEHEFTAQSVDAAGNEGAKTASVTITIDVSAPVAPSLDNIIDDVGEQTGEIDNASTTDDARPTISGTAEVGSTITLLDSGKIIGTAIVDDLGNWSTEPNIPLNTGDHSITVTATDEAGNISAESSPARTFTVDLPGPDAPSIDNVIDDVDPQQGNISKGTGVTDDTTPTVTGSAQVGATVTLYDADQNILGTALTDDKGNWSIAIADNKALSEGMQSLTAKAELNSVDSPETGAYTFEVDTSIPDKPGLLIVMDDQGPTVGIINNNDTTDDSTPTISGSGGTAGSTISVFDGDREIGTATVQANGTWSVTPVIPLGDGPHSISATETAPNGKVSEPSTVVVFTVDTSAVQVSISYISDDVEGIVGDVADNGLTNDSEPSVQGEATAGAVVTVLLGDTVIGSTTASSQGAWNFTVPTDTPLVEGANKLTAQVQNPSNETVTSNEFNVTLDKQAPSKIDPVIGTDDVGTVQGSIPENGKTDDPTPTFSGGGDPGDVIEIFDNGKPIGSTTVNAEGEWQFTPNTPLPAGDHSITVAPTDPAGNTGDPSKPLNFAVDFTPASAVTFDEVFDNQGVKTGVLANGDITDDRTPVLKGTGTQGELITVYDQGVAIASFTVTAATGDWEYELQTSEELGDGDHSLTVTSTNDAGATTAPTAARTFSLDGTQPAAPSINSVIDNDDDGSLHIPKDTGVTNDTTPVIEGTAGANLTVRVFDDGVLLGETTADNLGNWSFTVPADKALEEGIHKITADAVNDVGVKSESTGSYDFNVDITAAPAPSFTADDNVGDSQGAINNNDSTDDAQPTFSGTDAEALATITLRDADGSVLGSTKADDQGHWSITPVSALDDGAHTVSAIQTDQAGNDSLASETLTFTVDTTDVTVSITHAADNQEQHIDDIASGGITNDTTPDRVGRGKPDAVVTLTQDGTVIGSVAVDSNGDWSIAVPTLTDNKLYTFVAQAKDANGNQVSTGNFELTLDTQGPTAIDAITVSDDVGAIQGQLSDGDSSDDPTPTIAGKNATPDDIIEILDDGTVIGSTTVDALGNWTYTPENGLPEGEHKFSARPVDPAGNVGPETDDVTITLDFTPPPAPVITQVTDDVGVAPDIGEIDNGETTDDARPSFSGTAEAGSTITLLDDGVAIGTALVDAQGNWSAEPEIPLNTGDHSITVIATDAAGNTSPASEARTFTVDLPGPDAPAIDNVIDDVDPQQGNISKGTGVTDDTTPTVTGSAQIGATVTLYDADQNILGTALTDDQGNWSIAIADNKALSEGMQSLTAKAELDNVESPETGAYTFKVDSSTPDAPGMKVMDDIGATQGEITTTDPVTVTDDATPTLTGTDGTPGSVITVKDGDNVIGTATVDKDGKWSVTPTEPLGKGPHSLTSTETGPNGKVSDPSPAVVFNVDVSDVEVSITRIVDDVEGIVGNISDNGITNDAQPNIEGTATAGAVVSIYINAEKKGEATADSKGNWSFSLPAATPLAEGANSIEAKIQNPSNETVTSNEFNVTLDLEAPSKIDPVIGTDDVGTVQGSIPENGKTDDPTPTFSGGGDPGDVIEIFDNGKPIGSTTVNAEGEWQFTPSTPLPAGDHSITVAPTDPAGNTGDPSKPLNFAVDFTPASAVTFDEVFDNQGVKTGVLANGDITDDRTPVLKGTGTQGELITVYDQGVAIASFTVTAATGDWEYELQTSEELGDGDHSLTVTSTNDAGATTAPTAARTFSLDGTQPAAPSINSVIDNDDNGSLHIPKDTGVTNDTTPVIEGTAGANLTVRVFDDGVLLGETTADNLGNWSFTVPVDKALEEGLHKITADAVNDVGVKSEPTGSYDFNVDITAAPAPSFTADDNVGDSQGAINNNDSTDDAQPTFSGTDAEALATITLRDADGSVLGSTKADDQGHWSITPVSALDDGAHTVSAIQTDQAGNDSLASETLTFTVDTTDVTVSITHAADNQEQHIDDIASGGITNDTTPDIVGRGKPDAVVTLTQDGTVIGSVAVDSNGDWSIAVPTLTDNKLYTFVAQAKDANGNQVSTGNFELTLDTQGPTAIDAITVSDDVGAIQGQLSDGDSSDDPTPTIAGKNATPDDIIEILDDGTVIGSTTVDALGNWTYTPENGLPEGEHKFSARPVDPAGNVGPETDDVTITLDFTPPPAPVITQVTDDVGVAPDIGEIDNGETTDDARPSFSGTAEAGSTITLLDDGVAIGTALVDAQGNWSAEPEIPLNTGDHSITVIATDAAGNTSPASEARTFTVDLPGPDAPAIDNVIDDVDPQQGNISKGTGVTDDTTPTVTGSAQIGATVTLYDADQNILGTALTDDQGNWSIAIADNKALSEGMQSLTAKAELDNVESPETGAYTFKVDSSTPDAPGMKVMDDIGATQGEITTTDPVTVTDDATPTLTGTDGTPGSVITVKDGDNVIGTATVDKDGKWSVTPTEPLGKGPHSLTSTETGPNGKVSDPSPAVVFNVDVSDVEVSITRIVDDVEGIVGNISDNGLTNDAQPNIEGTATAGAVVSIYINAEKKGEATADSKGNWSFSLPAATPLAEGANSIEAKIQNPSNETVTSNEFNVTLDKQAPSKIDPVIGTDDVGTVQGSIPENGKTDDPTPTFSGGGDPGDVIEIFDNGKPIGSTTVNAEGEWQFTPSTPLPAGDHSITVAPTDPAGNTGDPSKPLKFEIDITADDIAINITEIIDNVPMQVGDISDGGLTKDITPELKGTLDQGLPADGKVEILRDGIVIGVATTVGTDWSYTDAALQDGQTYVYTARVSDTAGNVAGVSTSRSIQIDAANPDTPIVDLSTRSDSTLVGLESLDHILKHDDFTIFKQLEFDGNTDASEAGSIVYYYAYATNARKNSAGNLTDEGTYHDLLQETTSGNQYSAQHKFLLGSAEVRADGSWTMKMTDTEDNPLLSKVKSVDANGNEIAAQYFIHVDAQIVDTAGNQSSLSSALKITIETTDKNDQTRDPLILDLDGDGIHTVSINNGITFDHDGDGVKENSGWVSSTDGLLVRDINNDGLITSGSELFGDNTALSSGSSPAADGYDALADLDSNHDNVINSLDDKFSELKVWIDADQDGITDSGELKSLAELGITELSLDYKEVALDEFGNQIIKQSSFVQNSETKTLSDVNLAAGPNSGGISFVNLVSGKELVGSVDVGDGSSQASNLSLKVVVPPLSLAGEYFFITIDGPAGVTRVTHLVTAQDVSTGEVVMPLPNNALQANNSYVDGDYSLSLVVSTVSGAVTPYPGIATFTLDTIAPDAPSNVEIVNGADDYLDTDELADNVTVKVTLTANAKVGDVLEIDVSGDGVADATYIIQSADIGNSVELAIAGSLFNVNAGTNQVSAVATLIDPANNSSSQTVGMSDVVLNIDPTANDDTYTLNQAIELQVLSNDTDQDNDSLSVSAIKTAPEHGTVVINANGTITYTPDAGYVGDDQFEYEISDGKGGTDTANVNLEVFPKLSKPSIDLAASSDSGKSNTDNITNDNTPRLVGKADANVTVTVYAGNTKIGETTTDDQGHWFIESTLLNDGTYALTAISSIGGFESPASNPLSVQIDTVVDASMSLPSAQEAGAWFGHAPQVKFELTTTEHVQYSVKDVAFSWGSRVWYNPGHSITANGEAASSTTISASHTSQYSHGWFTFQATLTDVAGNVKTTNLTPVVVDPIASLKDGGYIVTYLSPSAATDGLFDVHAQRYDVNGDKVGDSFVVNSYLKNQQINADVTGLEDGGFVVTWQSEGQDGDGFGIYAQRYDVNNQQVGDEFQVSSYEIADQVRPEITSLADGGYVISWMSYGQDGSENGIYMQIFNQAGEKVSAEILVNTSVASDQALPSITHLDNGDFVVSWQSNHDGEYNVYGRIFNSQGIEVKSEFIISSSQSASQVLSNISNLADGGFVTSWLSQDTSDNLSINVQLFNQNGMSVLLNDIVISKNHEVVWSKPEVAGLNDGSFVVIWAAVDDTDTNIYLSKYDAQGEILLSEQIVNSEVQGIQSEPHVVALEDGGYLITWTDIQIEGETMTIMGQQYDADDQLVKGQFEVGKVISSELAASEIGDDADQDTNQLSNLLETETISYTEQQAVKFETNDYIAPSATDISASDILDISFLLESGDVQMDSLDHYLHFEQAGDDLLVYIDENGSFSAESFDQEAASQVITLADTHIMSTDYEDIMKELIGSNKIVIDI